MIPSAVYMMAPNEAYATAYVEEQGIESLPFGFPTVMGWLDAKPVGLLGTLKSQSAVIAGPLVVTRERNSGPTILRLIDAYDKVMKQIGITQYLFSIFEGNPFIDQIKRVTGEVPFGVNGKQFWFRRDL